MVHADLELVIAADKEGYVVGENIFLEMSLHNAGSATIRAVKYSIVPADDPNKNNLEILIIDSSDKRLSRVSYVLTGRLEFYPEILRLNHGETYRQSIQLAGTFMRTQGRKKLKQALWNFGEDPEIYSSEYPAMSPGKFRVQVIYCVTEQHLISLSEAERVTVWQGGLPSNILEISIR